MDAKTWKMLWKKEAREKSRMRKGRRGEHTPETGSWKACIVDFALLPSWLDPEACFGGPVSLSAQWGNRPRYSAVSPSCYSLWLYNSRSFSLYFRRFVPFVWLLSWALPFFFFFPLQLLLFIHITRFPSSIHRRGKFVWPYITKRTMFV